MWSFRSNVKITDISLKSQLTGGRQLEEEAEKEGRTRGDNPVRSSSTTEQ